MGRKYVSLPVMLGKLALIVALTVIFSNYFWNRVQPQPEPQPELPQSLVETT